MSDYLLQGAIEIELNEETVSYQAKRKKTLCYEILHGERKVAEITTNGQAFIYDEKFLPYDLYLEEGRDFEIQLNNIDNFNHWCASRVLSLDRKYAKEILNSIGMAQAITDRKAVLFLFSFPCIVLITRSDRSR